MLRIHFMKMFIEAAKIIHFHLCVFLQHSKLDSRQILVSYAPSKCKNEVSSTVILNVLLFPYINIHGRFLQN